MSKIAIAGTLIVLITTLGFSIDPSTPGNGNLYIEIAGSFMPNEMIVYDDDSVLHESKIIRADKRLFRSEKDDIDFAIHDRTLDSDISWINEDTFVVLKGNSDRYRHGILGDNFEASGFQVYKHSSLIAEFELPNNLVFETLRPLIADIVPENPGAEVVLTSSSHIDGSRIEIYSQNGEFLGNSAAIGRGFRWLHIIAVAPFSGDSKPYIAVVRTPHINGILEIYSWNGSQLVEEASFSGVSTHRIGSDNLNMALAINMDRSPGPEILIPSFDFTSLVIVTYAGGILREVERFDLPGKISTNIFFDTIDSKSVWVGLSNGKIVKLSE